MSVGRPRTSACITGTGAQRVFHGEAKTWHGLARAVRRGMANMKIQAYLTATAINLKRLAAALLAPFQLLLLHTARSGRLAAAQAV